MVVICRVAAPPKVTTPAAPPSAASAEMERIPALIEVPTEAVLLPERTAFPLPAFTTLPPDAPERIPANVTMEVEVPKVRALPPRVTVLLATPLKSPMVIEDGVIPLTLNIEEEAVKETDPAELIWPEPERERVPPLIVVPPV